MSNRSQVDEVIESMRGLTRYEKTVARKKLIYYFDGRMPLWDKQVQRTGVKAVAYIWVGTTWGIWGGVSVLCANALFLFRHKPSGLLYLQLAFSAIFFLGTFMYVVRRVQSLRAGKSQNIV